MNKFENKTAVVTGAASGIGLALSEVFAREGMNVVMADIEVEALSSAREKIAALTSGKVIDIATDVGKAEDMQRLAAMTTVHCGDTHILCNNAGVFTGGQLWECSLADYQWLIDVNIWSVIHGIRSFLPAMISRGESCHIVNTASMAGMTAMPFAGIYHMTKHAVLGLSECLYKEMLSTTPHVGVSALCPELIGTGIFQAERNRPTQFSTPGDLTGGDAVEMLRAETADVRERGLNPKILAERVLQAIRDEQFYILPPEENPWCKVADTRFDEIRNRRNPELVVPEEDER